MRRTSLSTSLRRTEGWAVNKASQIHLRGLWRLWAWKRRASAMRVDGGLAIAAPTKSATWGTTAALDSARVLFSGQRGEKIREICEQVASDGPSRLERSVRSSRLCGHVVGGPWATRRPRFVEWTLFRLERLAPLRAMLRFWSDPHSALRGSALLLRRR